LSSNRSIAVSPVPYWSGLELLVLENGNPTGAKLMKQTKARFGLKIFAEKWVRQGQITQTNTQVSHRCPENTNLRQG